MPVSDAWLSLHCKASISRLAVELIFLKLCVDIKKKFPPREIVRIYNLYLDLPVVSFFPTYLDLYLQIGLHIFI